MPDTTSAATLAASLLRDARATFHTYRQLAERALAQVDDDAFFRTIDAESNSLSLLVKHLGGNLRSRWTDPLTTDGEKPTRDRDREFERQTVDTRASLMELWRDGFASLDRAFDEFREDDLLATIRIRGEPHTVEAAILRSLAHTAQHVGQIVFLAKHLQSAQWKTLSIPRGRSADFVPGKT